MSRSASHYKTLGIPRDASAEDVRAAYRRMARRYHPDRYEGRGDSSETMARINNAYQVLSDPQGRAAYDESLKPPARNPTAGSGIGRRVRTARHRPWLLLWFVLSVVVLTLGWVAVMTLVPGR